MSVAQMQIICKRLFCAHNTVSSLALCRLAPYGPTAPKLARD